MKYLQSGGFQNQPLMRLTLGLALLLLAGFWVTNLALYFSHMNLDPASVVSYYRGNEAEFAPPRSASSMLEITHMHLPMFAIVLLLLTHLLIFAPMRFAAKVAFIIAAFGSALLSEAAGWMTRFWHPGFAILKVAMFVLFQAMLAYLILGLGWFLAGAHRCEGRSTSRGASIRRITEFEPSWGRAIPLRRWPRVRETLRLAAAKRGLVGGSHCSLPSIPRTLEPTGIHSAVTCVFDTPPPGGTMNIRRSILLAAATLILVTVALTGCSKKD